MEKALTNDAVAEDKKEERLERYKRVRKAYEDSGLNYEQLSRYIGVKRNTLANWLTKSARRVPPEYVVKMIEERVKLLAKESDNNGESISAQSDAEQQSERDV